MKPSVRQATKEDLPELTRWVERSLDRECRRDPLLRRGGGDTGPYLAGLLRDPRAGVVVLEVEGVMAGYLLAGLETFTGPRAPRSLPRRLLDRVRRRPRPRPVFAPTTILWVQDVLLDRAGRRADGARHLARWVAGWARENRADRIAGTIHRRNGPARAFATALGLVPLREVFCRDIEDQDRFPPFPERAERDNLA